MQQTVSQQSSQDTGGSDPPVPIDTAGPAPPPDSRAGIAVRAALAEKGKAYIWGGARPDGSGCSGLVMYAWGQAGISLDHGPIAQFNETTRVSANQLKPGDLVFNSPPGDPPVGHVNMYIGNGETVEADATEIDIRVESMYFDGPSVGFGRPG